MNHIQKTTKPLFTHQYLIKWILNDTLALKIEEKAKICFMKYDFVDIFKTKKVGPVGLTHGSKYPGPRICTWVGLGRDPTRPNPGFHGLGQTHLHL